MTSTLEVLLVAIRDRTGDGSTLARARALLAGDERIPADVREVALADPAEAEEDAVALLAVLGVDDLGAQLWAEIQAEIAPDEPPMELVDDDGWAEIADCLREGIRAEAGSIEIASAVLRRLPLADFPWGPIVADAVQAEAGGVELADGVIASVAPSESIPVARAVRAEAGEVDVADAVLAELGLRTFAIRDAVLAEAGAVDLVDAVMDSVLATAAMRAAQDSARAGVAAAEIPASPALGEVRIPKPANNFRRYGFVVAAMAAVALLSMFVGRLVLTPTDDAGDNMLFAQAGDVVIEDLSSGDDVSVTQLEGDDGAVILWIDEEAG